MKKKISVGIWGCGVVGGSLAKLMEQKFTVNRYDLNKKEMNNSTKEYHCANSDFVFFCVPTPMIKSTGKCYLGILNSAIDRCLLRNRNAKTVMIIKSTVPISTTLSKSLSTNRMFFFNPEFLVEKTALRDTLNQKRVIIGGPLGPELERIKKMYKIILPKAEQFVVLSREAEAIKYFNNVALAGQVAIFNEIYEVLEANGVNYNRVREIASLDHRIGRNSLISMDGKAGFGGKCFPKDLRAFIHSGKERGYTSYVLEEIWRTNYQRRGSYE